MPYPSKFVEFFGPCTWKTMHSVAFNYGHDPNHPTPAEEKAAKDFFTSLAQLLPCEACRTHYETYISKNPPDTSSRDALARWVYDLHQDVNKRRHVDGLTYDQVKTDYTGWDQSKVVEMSAYSTQERLKKLADPHFGRKIAHHFKEEMDGIFDAPDKLMAIIVIGAAAGGLLYYFSKKEEKK